VVKKRRERGDRTEYNGVVKPGKKMGGGIRELGVGGERLPSQTN